MRKFSVNNDEKRSSEPTPEQIERQKDFSRLTHEYERATKRPKKPLYRDPKLFLLLIVILLMILLIFLED